MASSATRSTWMVTAPPCGLYLIALVSRLRTTRSIPRASQRPTTVSAAASTCTSRPAEDLTSAQRRASATRSAGSGSNGTPCWPRSRAMSTTSSRRKATRVLIVSIADKPSSSRCGSGVSPRCTNRCSDCAWSLIEFSGLRSRGDGRQYLFSNLIGLELSGDVAHDGKTDRTGGEIEPPGPDLDGNLRAITT